MNPEQKIGRMVKKRIIRLDGKPDPRLSDEENARRKVIYDRLVKRNSKVIRDTDGEQYPPPFTARQMLAIAQDGIESQLRKLGFSRRRIREMGRRLENLPSFKPREQNSRRFDLKRFVAHFARRALFFIRRFNFAWKRGEWAPAAYYAFEAGRAVQRSLDYDELVEETRRTGGKSRDQRQRECFVQDRMIMGQIEEHFKSSGGRCSLKELHNCICQESKFGKRTIAYSTFQRIAQKGKWRQIRKKYSHSAK